MRSITLFAVALAFLAVATCAYAANQCYCECCTGANCTTTRLGPSPVTFCTECNDAFCQSNYDECPNTGSQGTVIGDCSSAGAMIPSIAAILLLALSSAFFM